MGFLLEVGCFEDLIRSLANKLFCKVGKLPISYLGLPIGGNMRSKAFWNLDVKKFERKLLMWRRNYLPMGGRITSLKVTLPNLLIYYIFLFKMPMSVWDRLVGWITLGGISFGTGKVPRGRFIG